MNANMEELIFTFLKPVCSTLGRAAIITAHLANMSREEITAIASILPAIAYNLNIDKGE